MKKKKYRNSAFYKPNTVQIELVQGCNRSCFFCGSNGFERKLHFISKDVLRRECELIAESGYNPRILIAGHGENALHPNFYSCIKLIRKVLPTHWVQILTNGYGVRKDLNAICKMFDAGLNDVTLDEYKDSKFDDDEIQELLGKYEEETGTHVEFVRMQKGVPLYAPKQYKKHRLLIIPAIEEEEICVSRKLTNHCGAGMPPRTDYSDRVCSRIFREMSFRWDGWVAMCCQDFRGQYPVVNCMDPEVKCFDDMWRHPRYEAARRILFHDHRTFFPCNVCDHIPMREGLLPDHLGKQEMEEPTEEDYDIVLEKHEPLTVLRARDWEKETGITCADNLNLPKKGKKKRRKS